MRLTAQLPEVDHEILRLIYDAIWRVHARVQLVDNDVDAGANRFQLDCDVLGALLCVRGCVCECVCVLRALDAIALGPAFLDIDKKLVASIMLPSAACVKVELVIFPVMATWVRPLAMFMLKYIKKNKG